MKRKLEVVNGLLFGLILLLIAGGATWTIIKLTRIDHTSYDNEFRVDISKDLSAIQNGSHEEAKYPYLICDLKGIVSTTTWNGVRAGDKVNINEMNAEDKSFFKEHTGRKKCFALIEDGETTGFVVFIVPKEVLESTEVNAETRQALYPFLCSIVLSLIVILCYLLYAKRNVYHPIREISSSAKAIINGNYNKEVVRVYGEKLKQNEVGELIYCFEMMRDELKEKQIKENELKLANQELISCISHDLRTPLSTIKAYAEGIRDGIANTEEKRKDYIEVILSKTNLLVTMIKELLAYSNARASRMSIQRKECYFYDFIKPLLKELRPFIEKNDIQAEIQLLANNVLVSLDKKRITEVIYNLVENSMKYMDKQEKHIAIHISDKEGCLLFQVIDNGMGIEAKDILYVFDKFYRAETSRSPNIPGSGLGLSICQYIIKEHGGEIYCKSHVGKDCEIGFTIPIS